MLRKRLTEKNRGRRYLFCKLVSVCRAGCPGRIGGGKKEGGDISVVLRVCSAESCVTKRQSEEEMKIWCVSVWFVISQRRARPRTDCAKQRKLVCVCGVCVRFGGFWAFFVFVPHVSCS